MKKLNRKGFTLVELLAVIVILAIVVGIAIPGVTNVINGAKHSAMETALKTAHGFLQKQYDIMIITPNNVDSDIKSILNATEAVTLENQEATLKKLGFNDNSVASLTITRNSNNFCLTINTLTEGSDYLSATYWENNGNPKSDTAVTVRQYGSC